MIGRFRQAVEVNCPQVEAVERRLLVRFHLLESNDQLDASVGKILEDRGLDPVVAIERVAFAEVDDPRGGQVVQHLGVRDRFASIEINPQRTAAWIVGRPRSHHAAYQECQEWNP